MHLWLCHDQVIQRFSVRRAETAQMLLECRGILDKEGHRRWGTGKYEMVVWHERYIFAVPDALIYQVPNAPSSPPVVLQSCRPSSQDGLFPAIFEKLF